MKQSFLNLRSFTMLKGAIMTGLLVFGLASCSEKDMPNAPEEEEGVESIAGVSVNVINDADELSKYVTNYKKNGGRAIETPTHTTPEWEMPALPTSFDGMTEVKHWSDSYDLNGANDFYVAEGEDLTFTQISANSKCNLYIYGKLTAYLAITNGINVYIAPGAELVLKDNPWWSDGSQPGLLKDDKPTNLYIYGKGDDAGKYVGSYTSASKTGLYVEGNLKTEEVEFGGTVRVGGDLIATDLKTNNCDFYAANVAADTWTYNNDSKVNVKSTINVSGDVTINAQNVNIEAEDYIVGGKFHMENNSNLFAYSHMTVGMDAEVSTQGTVYTPCLYVKEKLYIKNCATLNIPNYIHCSSFEASASGFTINMNGNALIDAGESFTIQNKDWTIAFDNDADTKSAIVAVKFQIMEGQAAYITGYAYLSADIANDNGYWGKPSENFKYYQEGDNYKSYNVQETVKPTVNGVTISSDPEDCTPEFKTPETKTPPTITELISSITHTHDISATCVALYNGKAYLSWHKRGTSIHGCLEALKVENDMAKLTSWMEVEDDDTEGGNNWDGNSAVSGADAAGEQQGQFDFNHLIVAEGRVVTVGDNAKMGGFIGSIALDGNGDFGTNGTLQDAFSARQLLSKVTDSIKVTDKIGRSGNAVLYDGSKYYIACAGGFQEYNGEILNLFTKETYKNGKFKRWAANLGDYKLTSGSAKHIAINPAGDKVATLELTSKGNHKDGDDYWFNDTETAIGAVLKVRDANNWLSTTEWETNIGDICPIYGKNSIAIDAAGNVYVAAGRQGLLVYNNGNKVGEFSIAKTEKDAGANGVAIDDKYVYVAYGLGGLYILNKSDLSVVSWYKSNAPVGYTTQAAAASANYVAVDGQYIYVAYGRHGVKVLKLND